mgnify:CR=1 FL=1
MNIGRKHLVGLHGIFPGEAGGAEAAVGTLGQLDHMLQVVGEELMPEVDLNSCGNLFAEPENS